MFKFSRRKVIKLNDMDAAIILKENGAIEASLPKVTTDSVPPHILMGAALMYALSRADLCQLLQDTFLQDCCPSYPTVPSNDF
jgi:hypothetical protein